MILKYSFNEFDNNLNNNKIIVLDFYSNNCSTCVALNSILEEVDNIFYDKIIIFKINVYEELFLKNKFNVLSTPKLYFIKNGKICGIHNGIISKDALFNYIDDLLKKPF